MQHLDEGTIHAWLDGALPADESTGVERHVAQCKECASLVAEARGMIAGASRIVSALDVVPGGVIPKSSRTKSSSGSLWRALRLTPSRAALAATLVIAASTVLTLRHDTPTKIVPMNEPAANAPAPVVSASPPPAAPIKEETPARQEAKTPPLPSVKADRPVEKRREVADARTKMMDSLQSAAKAKSPAAEVTTANSAVADRVIAAAPTAPPPVAAGAAAGGAVPAEARRSPAKVSVDSTRPLAKASADSVRMEARAAAAAFAPRPQTVPALRATAQRLASDATASFSGCYQLTDSAAKDKSLPLRFALDLMRADPGANVVRAVSPDGVRDTVIGRASWQPVAQNLVGVQLPSAEKMLSLLIRFPAGGNVGVATITGDGPARSVSVTRLTCR
jgi:hypothetical protein